MFDKQMINKNIFWARCSWTKTKRKTTCTRCNEIANNLSKTFLKYLSPASHKERVPVVASSTNSQAEQLDSSFPEQSLFFCLAISQDALGTRGVCFPSLQSVLMEGKLQSVIEISLLLRHWYEITAFYYLKSVLTEISVSRHDMGHATNV